jgi:hypothetical protein
MKCHFHKSWGTGWPPAWVSFWRRIRQHGFTKFITEMAWRIYIWCTSSERLLCSTSLYTRGLLSSWSPLWNPRIFLITFFVYNIILLSTVNTNFFFVVKNSRAEKLNVSENCLILGYYTASSGNYLRTFRDNLSVLSSIFKNPFWIPDHWIREWYFDPKLR